MQSVNQKHVVNPQKDVVEIKFVKNDVATLPEF